MVAGGVGVGSKSGVAPVAGRPLALQTVRQGGRARVRRQRWRQPGTRGGGAGV